MLPRVPAVEMVSVTEDVAATPRMVTSPNHVWAAAVAEVIGNTAQARKISERECLLIGESPGAYSTWEACRKRCEPSSHHYDPQTIIILNAQRRGVEL
jgi:hypothetical protein